MLSNKVFTVYGTHQVCTKVVLYWADYNLGVQAEAVCFLILFSRFPSFFNHFILIVFKGSAIKTIDY